MKTFKGIRKAWWKEQVVYQIYPRSFKDSNGDGMGDLQGIIAKIDYLDELGIDIVWLSPHFDSPNADNGYDIRNYREVMTEFGTMADFDLMLEKLKERGIKLIIDLVVNHSSDEHAWFEESKLSKDNPYRDYYIWRAEKDGQKPNNWPSFFGGSAWEKDNTTGEYYLHYFSKKQPDLNWENTKLRQEVHSVMKFWLDKGVDGFRMDVIPLISKQQDFADMTKTQLKNPEIVYASGPRLHEYLQEMNSEVLSQYDSVTVGEAFGVSAELMQRMTDERRGEIDMAFLFDIVRIGRDNWLQKEWSLPELKALFTMQSATDKFHWPTVFLNNHDNPRSVSKFGNASSKYRAASSKLLALLTLTQYGTPFLYQGEEIGMTNYPFKSFEEFDDIEIRGNYGQILKSGVQAETYLNELNKSSRDHSRTPMQWTAENQAGFTDGNKSWLSVNPNYTEINVETQLGDTQSVLHFYRTLLKLRKGNDDLIYGDYFDILPDHKEVFAYTRTGEHRTYLIVLNMSEQLIDLNLPENFHSYDLIISNYARKKNKKYSVRPWEAGLYCAKID
ncbi:alpha-glucosidase [Aggregatimonas sangjinii]|uniref:Alpha-glucosidase n=1 Tax=Aggregatimonas sangjinii TaxID=2583587 RepID=A0A5B7SQ09_9FLAO|nr:alpha-glucosidase [Aggregatimonas sangjinii]QCX00676.1 alpha-glucosidase [Aggregatimonas sangjinii]